MRWYVKCQAEAMAVRLAAFKRTAAAAGVLCIYVNDNFGRWRSASVKRSRIARQRRRRDIGCRGGFGRAGVTISYSSRSIPDSSIRRSTRCSMRELKLFVPTDCIVSNTLEENEHALRQI